MQAVHAKGACGMLRQQRRVVDLDALRGNVREIRRHVPDSAKLMAVVKADAYGHGALPVARAALEAGADWLAVALVEEGLALREGGITAPILMLGLCGAAELAAGVAGGITLSVCAPETIRALELIAERSGRTALCHLAVDTGMGRIGVRTAAETQAVLDALAACPRVRLTGAFTHFAAADEEDLAFTEAQLRRFAELTAPLPAGVMRHCANSAAIHRLMPGAAFDMVRMGISLYGCPPVASDWALRGCMRWEAPVTWVKEISAGDTVGYGCAFRAERPMRVATIACGYGDGYHRAASGRAEVLLHGRRARVLGRICMDQMMADVTDIPGAAPGDTAVLLGEDGGERITADELAGWSGTISYEILLAATCRVPCVWQGERP